MKWERKSANGKKEANKRKTKTKYMKRKESQASRFVSGRFSLPKHYLKITKMSKQRCKERDGKKRCSERLRRISNMERYEKPKNVCTLSNKK